MSDKKLAEQQKSENKLGDQSKNEQGKTDISKDQSKVNEQKNLGAQKEIQNQNANQNQIPKEETKVINSQQENPNKNITENKKAEENKEETQNKEEKRNSVQNNMQNSNLSNSQNLEISQNDEPKNEFSAEYVETLKKMKKIKHEIYEVKNANANIREALKSLNTHLTHELERTKFKKVEQETEEDRKSKEKQVLENEIKTAKKQIESYNKQLTKLKDKSDPVSLLEKIKATEEAIQGKKEYMTNQKIEIKNLVKLIRAEENQINMLQSETDFSKHINILSIESKAARERLNQMQARLNLDEKNFKKQQEFLTKLEIKCNEISPQLKEKIEIEAVKALIMKEYEARENLAVKNSNEKRGNIKLRGFEKKEKQVYVPTNTKPNLRGSSVVKNYREDNSEDSLSYNEVNFAKLNHKIEVWKKSSEIEQKKNSKIISTLEDKIYELEFKNREILSMIKEAERNNENKGIKLDDLKRSTKFVNLTPIDNMNKRIFKDDHDTTTEVYYRLLAVPGNRKTKREIKGGNLSIDCIPFNDIDVLGDSMYHKINHISFFTSEYGIHGFQSFYRNGNQIIEGFNNIAYESMKNLEVEKVDINFFEDDPFIKIRMYYTDVVEYIVFESAKGNNQEIGIKESKNNGKEYEFKFDFTYDPLLFLGALDSRKNLKTGMHIYYLAMFGVETKLKVYSEKKATPLNKIEIKGKTEREKPRIPLKKEIEKPNEKDLKIEKKKEIEKPNEKDLKIEKKKENPKEDQGKKKTIEEEQKSQNKKKSIIGTK